jgi:hypothetical protein
MITHRLRNLWSSIRGFTSRIVGRDPVRWFSDVLLGILHIGIGLAIYSQPVIVTTTYQFREVVHTLTYNRGGAWFIFIGAVLILWRVRPITALLLCFPLIFTFLLQIHYLIEYPGLDVWPIVNYAIEIAYIIFGYLGFEARRRNGEH